jgi:hypothetical protein
MLKTFVLLPGVTNAAITIGQMSRNLWEIVARGRNATSGGTEHSTRAFRANPGANVTMKGWYLLWRYTSARHGSRLPREWATEVMFNAATAIN